MSRILALDYGGKRTGIASTDPLQIIASPLITVETKDLLEYLSFLESRVIFLKNNNALLKKSRSYRIVD